MHMACFLSAALPLQSAGYAPYHTLWHLCIQFSSSFQHVCCDASAARHHLMFFTQRHTCPNSPALTSSTRFSLLWCPAWWPCMPTTALTGTRLLIDTHTVQHLILRCRLFALQSPFQILRAQFAFDSRVSSWYFLLEWFGEDSHMLEHIFVVWVTPNICAFSRPLFLLAYIQTPMPYGTFTTCVSSLPLPRLTALTLPLQLSPVFNRPAVWDRYFRV